MAKAKDKPTAETWDTLQAAQPLILKICLSPSQAGPWLAEQVFGAEKTVQIRWQKIDPLDARIEDLGRGSLPTINFADNSIAKLVVLPLEAGAVGLYPVTLLGVEVLRESIIALRPGLEIDPPPSQQPIKLNIAHATIGEVSFAESITRLARRMMALVAALLEPPQSQQPLTLHVAHATIGEVSFAAPVMRMARRIMALAAALMRKPIPPAKEEPAEQQQPGPAPKELWRGDRCLEWLYEKIEQHGRPKLGEKTNWCRERLKEGKIEFVAGEFPWKDKESVRTKLNDILAGRLIFDLRTRRVVPRPKQKK